MNLQHCKTYKLTYISCWWSLVSFCKQIYKYLIYLSFLGAGIQYTEPNSNYFITQGREKIIQNRFMSFKLKTCSTAYVLLGAVKLKDLCSYNIVINDLNGELYSISYGDIIYESRQPVLHCDIYTDLFITWDDYAITVTLGLKSNGSVLGTWSPLFFFFALYLWY